MRKALFFSGIRILCKTTWANISENIFFLHFNRYSLLIEHALDWWKLSLLVKNNDNYFWQQQSSHGHLFIFTITNLLERAVSQNLAFSRVNYQVSVVFLISVLIDWSYLLCLIFPFFNIADHFPKIILMG